MPVLETLHAEVEAIEDTVPTAIAGIYGMNFEFMPELKWSYGYFLMIGVIAAICGTLYWRSGDAPQVSEAANLLH